MATATVCDRRERRASMKIKTKVKAGWPTKHVMPSFN
jgi:hypothetical protein